MSLSYIRKVYGVPAKRGQRVTCHGGLNTATGRISGASQAYIRVILDGETKSRLYHPTDRVTYNTK
jgi:hypothetical protein